MGEGRRTPEGAEDFRAPDVEPIEKEDPIIYIEKLETAFFKWCKQLTGDKAGSINEFFDSEPFSAGGDTGLDDMTILADCSSDLKRKVVDEIASWRDRLATELSNMKIVSFFMIDGAESSAPFNPDDIELEYLFDIQFIEQTDEPATVEPVQNPEDGERLRTIELIFETVACHKCADLDPEIPEIVDEKGKKRKGTFKYPTIKAKVIFPEPLSRDDCGTVVITEEDIAELLAEYSEDKMFGSKIITAADIREILIGSHKVKERNFKDKRKKGKRTREWLIDVECPHCRQYKAGLNAEGVEKKPKVPLWGTLTE